MNAKNELLPHEESRRQNLIVTAEAIRLTEWLVPLREAQWSQTRQDHQDYHRRSGTSNDPLPL